MGSCRSFGHLRALVVAAVLVVGIPLFHAHAQFACSGVFQSALSYELLAPKMVELAKLKIKLDSNRAALGADIGFDVRVLQADYVRLVGQLQKASQLGDKEFRTALSKEISRQQNVSLKKEKSQKRKVIKQITAEKRLLPPVYELKKQIPMTDTKDWKAVPTNLSIFGDIVLKDRSGFLYTFSAKTGMRLVLPEKTFHAVMHPDGAHLIALTADRKLKVVDLNRNRIVREVEISIDKDASYFDFGGEPFMDFSPDGQRILIAGLVISVFEFSTGKKIFDGPDPGSLRKARLISSNEVIYAEHQNLYKVDIGTEEVKTLSLGIDQSVFDFEVAGDNKTALVYKHNRRYKADVANMTINPHERVEGTQRHSVKRIPGDNTHAVLSTKSNGTAVVYDMVNEVPVFDFKGLYKFDDGPWPLQYESEFYFAQDRSSVLVYARDGDAIHLDVWKLKGL